MQSYTIDHGHHTNIIEEVKGWFHQWAELNRRALANAVNRDPDSNLTRMLIAFWILVGICVIICTAFGVVYHFIVFRSVSGSSIWAAIAACLFLLVVEITTVCFGLYFFDAILEKMWWRSAKRLILVLGMGTIVFFAVRWSIGISTKGVAEVNRYFKTEEAYLEAELATPPEVIAIDEKLAELETFKEAGKKSTWKGRPTKEGLDLMQANTELQRDLERQREAILAAAQSRQDSLTQLRLTEAQSTSTVLIEYGGKAEYAKLFGLFLISLIGSILREKEKSKKEPPQLS